MQTQAHCHCPKQQQNSKTKQLLYYVPGFLIAILPKCPFCILSYTSAITVCTSKGMQGYAPHWASWISIAFVALTLMITIYNYKGSRTLIATLFILSGGVLIIITELFTGLLGTYYWGCALLLIGVWVNGSMIFFLKKITPFFGKKVLNKVNG